MTSSGIGLTSRILLTIILQFAAVHQVTANYPVPANLKQNDSGELAAQLFATAKEALTSELQILVSGDIEGSLKGKRLARLYRNAKSEQFRSQVSRRDKLKEFGLDYKEYSAEFTLKDVSIKGEHAVLKIAEFVSLKLDIPDGPASTEYSEDHSVEFKYDGGEWKLVKDELCRPPASPADLDDSLQPAVPLSVPLTNAPKGYRGLFGRRTLTTISDRLAALSTRRSAPPRGSHTTVMRQ